MNRVQFMPNVTISSPPAATASLNHVVPVPPAADTPGNVGDRAIDPVNGRTIFYTGDGTNHSWASAELVVYPPSTP